MFSSSLPIQGDGFVLREFVLSDVSPVADIEYDVEVKRFLALPKRSKDEWVKDIPHLGIRGAVIQLADGRVAGSGSLSQTKLRGYLEIRVVIGKLFWGQALGSKVTTLLVQLAFETLDANAVVAIVHPDNKASLSLVRFFGFCRQRIMQEETDSWQQGHYVYHLPRNVYNKNLVRTRPK